MAKPFYKAYLEATHREVFDTPEKVLQELYNIVADYQRITRDAAKRFGNKLPEHKEKFILCEILVSRWWLPLDILGLHTPPRFIKEVLCKMFADKRILALLEWQQVIVVGVTLLHFLEENPEELKDPFGEPWFENQQDLLCLLLATLINKHTIDENLFYHVEFADRSTPEMRKKFVGRILDYLNNIVQIPNDSSPCEQ